MSTTHSFEAPYADLNISQYSPYAFLSPPGRFPKSTPVDSIVSFTSSLINLLDAILRGLVCPETAAESMLPKHIKAISSAIRNQNSLVSAYAGSRILASAAPLTPPPSPSPEDWESKKESAGRELEGLSTPEESYASVYTWRHIHYYDDAELRRIAADVSKALEALLSLEVFITEALRKGGYGGYLEPEEEAVFRTLKDEVKGILFEMERVGARCLDF